MLRLGRLRARRLDLLARLLPSASRTRLRPGPSWFGRSPSSRSRSGTHSHTRASSPDGIWPLHREGCGVALLDGLRVRGLAQVSIHVAVSLISMLAVALSAVRLGRPGLVRCIKVFVE